MEQSATVEQSLDMSEEKSLWEGNHAEILLFSVTVCVSLEASCCACQKD